jgi:Zn-finger protein
MGNQHKEHKEHEWIVICFCQFITNKTKLCPLNKSSSIIAEKLGCQNCVIVHIGNVNHDMALK